MDSANTKEVMALVKEDLPLQVTSVVDANDNQLRDVAELIQEYRDQEDKIKDLEQEVKAEKALFFTLQTERLPAALDSINSAGFKTTNGLQIKLDPFFDGSLPKEDLVQREEALAWLRENGHEGIIKRVITMSFPKDYAPYAEIFLKKIQAALELMVVEDTIKEDTILVDLKEDVHHMTLKSWAREMMESDPPQEFPAETLGLFVGRRATVKLIPEKKERR